MASANTRTHENEGHQSPGPLDPVPSPPWAPLSHGGRAVRGNTAAGSRPMPRSGADEPPAPGTHDTWAPELHWIYMARPRRRARVVGGAKKDPGQPHLGHGGCEV